MYVHRTMKNNGQLYRGLYSETCNTFELSSITQSLLFQGTRASERTCGETFHTVMGTRWLRYGRQGTIKLRPAILDKGKKRFRDPHILDQSPTHGSCSFILSSFYYVFVLFSLSTKNWTISYEFENVQVYISVYEWYLRESTIACVILVRVPE